MMTETQSTETMENELIETSLGDLGETIQGSSFIRGQRHGIETATEKIVTDLMSLAADEWMDGSDEVANLIRDRIVPHVKEANVDQLKNMNPFVQQVKRDEEKAFRELDRRDSYWEDE